MTSVAQLKQLCRDKGIRGYSKMTKKELLIHCGYNQSSSSSNVVSNQPDIGCPHNTVRNPKTGRCVSKKGTIGKKILQNRQQSSDSDSDSDSEFESDDEEPYSPPQVPQQKPCPSDKILNPSSGRCVIKRELLVRGSSECNLRNQPQAPLPPYSPQVPPPPPPPPILGNDGCPPHKILNQLTGNCVRLNGGDW